MNNLYYWKWFFKGTGDLPGWRHFIDIWLLVHLVFGGAIGVLTPLSIKDAADVVLFPLAGILVGIAFGWAGNSHALLQSDEIALVAGKGNARFTHYVYFYQSAILIVLVTLVSWGLAGLGLADSLIEGEVAHYFYVGIRVFLFILSSITVRECWQVVLFSQKLLLVHRIMKTEIISQNSESKSSK